MTLPEITKKFEQEVYERVLSEGAVETLEALKEKGCRLGIISNNDGSCRQKCEQIGIAKYFEIIIDSTVEGVGKPSPKIFELALKRMRISAQEAAHVGDMYGADIMGARDVGLEPVWYNRRRLEPLADYRPDHEVERLLQIPEIL
jgi:putative hydrolase of the HAD superfamily